MSDDEWQSDPSHEPPQWWLDLVEKQYSTEGHKKFLRYFNAIFNSDKYQAWIPQLRKRYSIPASGFEPIEGYIYPPRQWKHTTAQWQKLSDEIRAFCKQYELPFHDCWTMIEGITQDAYDKYLQQFKSRQQEINLLLEDHTEADESYIVAASTVLNLATRALEIFESSEVPEKRALLNFLLQNCKVDGKKPIYSLRSPFDTILSFANQPTWLRTWDDVRIALTGENSLETPLIS